MSGPPFIDLFDGRYRSDPVGLLTPAREQHWYALTAIGPLVLRHSEVHAILRDPSLGMIGTGLMAMQGVQDGPLYDWWSKALFAADGDQHLRLRSLVSRAFTPRAVAQMRGYMSFLTTSLADRLTESADFIEEFADPYPIRVICALLGVAAEDAGRVSSWSADLALALTLEASGHRDRIERAVDGLVAYASALIDGRRRAPQADLVSALVAAEAGGDRLSYDELVAIIVNLIAAGHDTTRSQLAHAMVAFAANPAQWDLLAQRQALAANAAEEAMRLYPGVAATMRKTIAPWRFRDLDAAGEQWITLSLLSANRDPRAFTDADRFDITRAVGQAATFGYGAHFCLGASLARAELEVALGILARTFRAPETEGHPTFGMPTGIWRAEQLRLRMRRRA